MKFSLTELKMLWQNPFTIESIDLFTLTYPIFP